MHSMCPKACGARKTCGGGWFRLVEGGFADITPHKITILAENSINLTDIDDSVLKEKLQQIDENISNASESDKELLIEKKALIENFS